MMKHWRTAALLLVGSLTFATGCDDSDGEDDSGGGSGGDDRASVILGLNGNASNGQTLFSGGTCANAACHGPDGTSGMATPTLDTSVPNLSDAEIVNTFLNGKGGMPPQSQLSDQELADLLAYVSDTFG